MRAQPHEFDEVIGGVGEQEVATEMGFPRPFPLTAAVVAESTTAAGLSRLTMCTGPRRKPASIAAIPRRLNSPAVTVLVMMHPARSSNSGKSTDFGAAMREQTDPATAMSLWGKLERVTGIEPVRSAWEADKLPLHHTRDER
jgi:hypothetical protein